MDVRDGRPDVGGDSAGREHVVVTGRIEFANRRRDVQKSDFCCRSDSVGDPELFTNTIGSPIAGNDCGDCDFKTNK